MARTFLFRTLSTAVAADAAAIGLNLSSPSALSRRRFLKGAAGIAALSVLPEAALAARQRTGAGEIAIVGGGLAGLTAAYRLAQAGVRPTVIEADTRFGGRVHTVDGFYQGLFCELGGEFVDTQHEDLRQLVGELGLELERLQAEADPAQDLYFFSAAFRTGADMVTPATGTGAFATIAGQIADDRKALLDEGSGWTEHARRLDRVSLEDYLARFEGKTERWALDILRVAYLGEFGLPPAQQSCLNLVDMIGTDVSKGFQLLGDSDEAFRIKGGSARLVDALLASVKETCELRAGAALAGIERTTGSLVLELDEGRRKTSADFDTVILAIPFTVLRGVRGLDRLGLGKAKLTAIGELGYGNNAKLLVGTKTRAWRAEESGLPVASSGSFLSDLPFQSVWDQSRMQPGEAGVLTNFLAGRAAEAAGTEALGHLREGLAVLSPKLAECLDEAAAMFYPWAQNPLARGSYAAAMPGQYTTLLDATDTPELDGRLIFAGEHTSREFLGFMNGAVQSGNKAAATLIASQGRKSHSLR